MELDASVAVTSTAATIVTSALTAAQVIFTPDNIWIPLGVAFTAIGASLGTAIWATMRAVRTFDRINRNQRRIMKHLGLDDET